MMEENSSVEFDYFLAQSLAMTVDQMRQSVSNSEYVGWQVYYGRKAQREQLALKG